MFEMRKLDLTDYKGKRYEFQYTTPGYYEFIKKSEMSFCFEYKEYSKLQNKCFEDELVGEWLEKPILIGAYYNEQLAGFIEGSIETWNKRFRISNLLVFQEFRSKQLSKQLINSMIEEAKRNCARMVVLEVLSCNIPAIHCYLKAGFTIIGFDTYAFSNNDIENHEVRIEMGKVIAS